MVSLSGRLSETENERAQAQSHAARLQKALAEAEEGDSLPPPRPRGLLGGPHRHLPGSPKCPTLAAKRVQSWELLGRGPACPPGCAWPLHPRTVASLPPGDTVQRPRRARILSPHRAGPREPDSAVTRPISHQVSDPCQHREHPALWSPPLHYRPPPSTGLPGRRLEGGMSIEGKNVGEEERAEGARTPGPPHGTLEQQGIVRRGASSPHHLAPSHLKPEFPGL